MRFKDKVCVVTGGGSGIGKASCKRFAQEGGKVVVVDLNEQHGNETVQEIVDANGFLAVWHGLRSRYWSAFTNLVPCAAGAFSNPRMILKPTFIPMQDDTEREGGQPR